MNVLYEVGTGWLHDAFVLQKTDWVNHHASNGGEVKVDDSPVHRFFRLVVNPVTSDRSDYQHIRTHCNSAGNCETYTEQKLYHGNSKFIVNQLRVQCQQSFRSYQTQSAQYSTHENETIFFCEFFSQKQPRTSYTQNGVCKPVLGYGY